MSRVGKLPIQLPDKVKVELDGSLVKVSGPKGSLDFKSPEDVAVKVEGAAVLVVPSNNSDKSRAMWGMSRSIIANMVKGVSQGYTKMLEINGVGYRAAADKNFLTIYLGYSHEIKYVIPEGVEIKCPKPTNIEIIGFDKQLVGQIAAEIKSLRKHDPYKNKGIKLEGEIKRRKEGKKK